MDKSETTNTNPPAEKKMSIKSVKGLRSYYPTDKGPIDTYQLGKNGRVEYLAAEIAVDHLTKGKDTTDEWRKWAKERGEATDDVGLILSRRLGGSGIDKANLFPKSSLLDETTWKKHEQEAYEEASEMKKWKKIKFSVRLDYSSDESSRPSGLEYQYDLPSGSILYGKVKNTAVPSKVVEPPKEEEVEEEEEEEEVEEEEEEEEEVEEEVVEEKPVTPAATSEPKVEIKEKSQEKEIEEPEPEVTSPIRTIVQPPTPRPSLIESSPSPPPTPISEPARPIVTNDPPKVAPALREEYHREESPKKNERSSKASEDDTGNQDRGVITKSDLIDLIPVIGSCKLALETVQAAFNGNGKVALRKALQCGISLVADFYLGRAIVRHGKILSNTVTEDTIIRFVTKAENQILIVSAFKATNQLLNSLTRALS